MLASSLELDELAQTLSQYVTLKTKYLTKPTWSKISKKAGYIQHLFSRVLKPSMQGISRQDTASQSYPCTPFSSAGNRKGEDDPRHLWPFIRKHIEDSDPYWVFFENGTVISPSDSIQSYKTYSDLITRYKLAYSQRMSAEIALDAEHLKNGKESLYLDVSKPMLWATPNTLDHLPPKTGEALARNKRKADAKT